MPDDFSADILTTGLAVVGGVVTGELEEANDLDWFSVDLLMGESYSIDMEGSYTEKGTLSDPFLRGIYDAAGVLIPGTLNDDAGVGLNSFVSYSPSQSGTFYISAGPYNSEETGTYSLSVGTIEDDFTSDINTTAVIEVGGTATGSVDTFVDADWFAASLIEGTAYRFVVRGDAIEEGGVQETRVAGVYNTTGDLISNTNRVFLDDYSASGVEFTATETATYYLAAGGGYEGRGTYSAQLVELASVSGTDADDWLTLPENGATGLFGIDGGSGIDMMSFAGLDARVVVDTHADIVSGFSFSIEMDSIENITGTSFNDIIRGSDRAEVFRGLGGSDTFYGSDQGDRYDGGAGRDTLSYINANSSVSVSLLRDRGWDGDAAGDRLTSIENLQGSQYDDFLWGDHGNNRIEGGNGNDTIMGNDGDDYILAGLGTDIIVYSRNQADYTIVHDGIRTEVTDNVSTEGADVIGHAEILRFADGDLVL